MDSQPCNSRQVWPTLQSGSSRLDGVAPLITDLHHAYSTNMHSRLVRQDRILFLGGTAYLLGLSQFSCVIRKIPHIWETPTLLTCADKRLYAAAKGIFKGGEGGMTNERAGSDHVI